MTPRLRITIRRLVLCFAFGALTLAMVVVFAAWLHVRSPSHVMTGSFIDRNQSWVFPSTKDDWPARPDSSQESVTFGYFERSAGSFTIDTPAPYQVEYSVGFPFTCVVYRHYEDYDWEEPDPYGQIGPVSLTADCGALLVAFKDAGSAVIPLTPAFAGLLADLTVYAILWSAILWLPGHVTARRRRVKNLCARCGYSVQSLQTCPECGTPVQARSQPEAR